MSDLGMRWSSDHRVYSANARSCPCLADNMPIRCIGLACCARAASGHAAAPPSSLMKSRRFTASDSRASHRKDSTPRHGRLLHPSSWRNEMIAITPPIIFSKEVAQKQATPFPRQDLLTARNRFRPNFRGWRLDEFSIFARPPPRGLAHVRADDLEAFPSGLGHTASGTTYLPTR